MKIVSPTASDFDEILKLNEESVPHVNSICMSELQWFDENATYFKVVKIDSSLAGFIIGLGPGTEYASLNYRWFCDNYDNFAYVDRVCVSEWARRRGVAEALYKDFAAAQTDTPCMTCEVNIRPPNEGSMRFHERLHFRQVGSQEIDDGKKEVAMMEKRL